MPRSRNGLLLRAKEVPDFVRDRLALDRRARAVDVARPNARLSPVSEPAPVPPRDLMGDDERRATEAADTRAHLAAVAMLRRGDELALRADQRHRQMLLTHALWAVPHGGHEGPGCSIHPPKIRRVENDPRRIAVPPVNLAWKAPDDRSKFIHRSIIS